jgi:hydroxyacylglutathione hydrolase
VKFIEPADFYQMMSESNQYLLIDVRIWNDYQSNRIADAVWGGDLLHLNKLVNNTDVNTPLLIYCDYGDRTKVVAKILKKKGFKNIYQLNGGLSSWINQNFPLDTTCVSDSIKS